VLPVAAAINGRGASDLLRKGRFDVKGKVLNVCQTTFKLILVTVDTGDTELQASSYLCKKRIDLISVFHA